MLNQNQQVFEQIKKADNILITFSKEWSGDGISSALALFLFLKKIGKKPVVAAEKDSRTGGFDFLPAVAEIQPGLSGIRQFVITLDTRKAKVLQVKYKLEAEALDFIITPKNGSFTKDDLSIKPSGFKYDLIFVLDTRELESLGRVYDGDTELFYKVPVINIDHHPSNEEFGQINLIDLTAVSTTEVLFKLFEAYSRGSIDEDIATCLLAGMIAKTRSFKTPNITPDALSIASQLIAMGARREEIVNRLYRSRGLNVLKLWGLVLSRLAGSRGNRLVWSRVRQEDFTEAQAAVDDLNEVIDELIVNIPEVKVMAIFYETVSGDRIASHGLICAIKNMDAQSLLKEFEPTGSKTLAQIASKQPLPEFEKNVIAVLDKKIGQLPT